MSLSYTEWCDNNGFGYADEDHRAAWEEYCHAELRQPRPTSTRRLSGRITMTWQQEREAELRRRSYQRHWHIIWPRHRLRLVSLCLLFLLTSSALVLTGCANVSPEDRAFFYKGWVNPNAQPVGQ
jgi:hypothetical protein